MDDKIREYQNKMTLKEYFFRNSNFISDKCTVECGFDNFEDYILFKKNEEYVIDNNYMDILKCYDKCLSKHFGSSILGIQVLNENFTKLEIEKSNY
jgi:hypothetical protein